MLTDTICKNAKAESRPIKLSDGGGLVLEVKPANKQGRVVKAWRLRFTFAGKESMLALGEYPAVSLRQARVRREEARELIAKGISPVMQKRLEKLTRSEALSNSVSAVAARWMDDNRQNWSDDYAGNIARRLEVDVFPAIGDLPIADVTPKAILAILKTVQKRSPSQAKLLQTWIGGVFRYAVAHLLREDDPLWALRGAIKPSPVKHHPHLRTVPEIGEFLRAVDAAPGDLAVKNAVALLWLTVARSNEVVGARWEEFDLEAGLWRIPAARMKGRKTHVIPLVPQAVALLETMRPYSGSLEHVFPHRHDRRRHMTTAALQELFLRVGFGGKLSPHGVRGTFSTHFNGKGADAKLVEMCLAHAEHNKIKAAYDHAERLPERLALLTEWAGVLDAAKRGAKVLKLRKAG